MKNTDPTLVHIHKDGGFSLTGDAIPMFRVITLKGAIKLHRQTGLIPTRGVTISKMLAMAGEITGEKYKRGQHERAEADLQLWIDAAKASMPYKDDREG
jgi:hypothetical protein